MQAATYLMNSTKKEYMFVGATNTGDYLAILEKSSNWDLWHNTIYISHPTRTYDYKNLRDFVFKDTAENKGTVIEETIRLY